MPVGRKAGTPKTGGRRKGTANKATASIRDAARQYTEEALLALVGVLRDKDEPAAARVAASNAILDRAHGKPTQPIAGDRDGDPLSVVTRITLTAPGYDDGEA